MFKNYFKSAYRSLQKDKTSSFISITGLAIGMACCMLILIHIKDELSFNKFNANLDRVYRINWISRNNSGVNIFSSTPVPFSKSLASKIPGIEKVGRLFQRSGEMESGKNDKSEVKRFQEQNVYFSDPGLFDIFSIAFISGDKNMALSGQNTIIITDEMARKYFGSENPLGRSLFYDNKVLLLVAGVVKKMPANSDIKFDFLISFETIYQVESPQFAEFIKNDWTFTPCDTWIMLKAGQQSQNIQKSLNQYLQQYGTERNHAMNSVVLQPLGDIHLYAANVIGNASSNDVEYIYIFAGIAFLILLIANVNFINLSVARSIEKIKEVGVRKVLGADKKQLVLQFLSGTLQTSFIAFILAFILTEAAIPFLNQLTNKQFTWFSWIGLPNMLLFVVIFFVTGVLAGLYPAFYITRFNMALALRGKSGDHRTKNLIQKILLITQFAVSIVLIIGAIIIFQQIQFLREKPLGFQKRQMLVVPIFGTGAFSFGLQIDGIMRRRMNAFSDELNAYSRIKAVTASSEMPGQGFVRGLVIPQGNSEKDNIFTPWLSVDYNFIQTLNMQLVAGRNFSKGNGTDFLNAFIINESAVRAFGWKTPENAMGKTFVRGKQADGKKGTIIGVVKDFDFNSLTNPMEPLVMDVNPPRFTDFAISIQADHVSETIGHVKQVWDKIFPERVFEYSFLDKDIDAQYKDRENFSQMIEYFAISAILLSCSGLFSLAFFLAVKRSREIGIRKVLGADISAIVFLLSKDFIKMVLLASLIASPIGWWLMHNWLQGFAYHVRIEWWIFVLACFLTVLISFITIGFQSVKAAWVNPIDSLRSE
jgi:putative ABC transport system permease protein